MINKIMDLLIGTRAAAVAIIEKNGKVALTKRSLALPEGGKWCLPGGSIKIKENSLEAIKREVKEEIGLNITNTSFLFYHDEHLAKKRFSAVVLVFLAKTVGKVKYNFEVSDMKWFKKEEIEELNIAFTHKDIVRRYYKEK